MIAACRRAIVLGLVLGTVAPACAGRSISRVEDDSSPFPPSSDDGSLGGSGGGSYGGEGATGALGGSVEGGSFSSGGNFPKGGTSTSGGVGTSGGSIAVGGGEPAGAAGDPATGGTTPCDPGADRIGGGGFAGQAPPNTDPACKAISNAEPCPTNGTFCPNLACGLADSGRRTCVCGNIWSCTQCDFTGSPFAVPPCDIQTCPEGIADEVACLPENENTVCRQDSSDEVCACYASPVDGLVWDCDRPPNTWPAL